MAEFGKIVLFKDVDTSIEDGIKHIKQVVTKLQSNDLKRLFDDLDSLRHFVHEFVYWMNKKVGNQIEVEAERKVKAMIEAGFSFNAVTVDNFRFLIGGADEIQKCDPRQEDDELPF